MPQYVDFHSHIHFDRFAEDRDEVLSRMRELGVWTVVVGTDAKHSQEAVEFAREHEGVFASIGLHPADNTHEEFDAARYGEWVGDDNVVTIGECGLDYFHQKEASEQARQRVEFEKQIEFAVEYEKPLMLHIRDAHNDAIDMLSSKKRQYGDRLLGNVHFFTAGPDVSTRYYDLGFTTSFPGVITFASDYDEAVRFAPADMLLSETDSPYAAPVPHRGKRNEPAFVVEVVKRMAELRGDDLEVLRAQLVENAMRYLAPARN